MLLTPGAPPYTIIGADRITSTPGAQVMRDLLRLLAARYCDEGMADAPFLTDYETSDAERPFGLIDENRPTDPNPTDAEWRQWVRDAVERCRRYVDVLMVRRHGSDSEHRAYGAVAEAVCGLGYTDMAQAARAFEDREGDVQDGVVLATVHQAKGCEWPVCLVTGVLDGKFPLQTDDPEELAEERRIFFVGVTRAQHRLYLTAVRHSEQQALSVFVRELLEAGALRIGERAAAVSRMPETAVYRRRR